MRLLPIFLMTILLGSGLAGCLTGTQDEGDGDEGDADDALRIVDGFLRGPLVTQDVSMTIKTASGNIATISIDAFVAEGAFTNVAAPQVSIPDNAYLMVGDRFVSDKSFALAALGEPFHILVPPGMTNLTLTIEGKPVVVPTPDTGLQLVSGEQIIQWFKVQRDEYPNRCSGCPNYERSQQYFAELFESFGMAQVEVDPYGTNLAHPDFANVVAYKYGKTDTDHPFWLATGGHYDVVTGTTEGAFDDTSGTLAALEMARVFGNISTNHNLVFGLWGGEEAGLQGSNFFAKTNPNIAAQMRTYVNLDVVGFSWPGPPPTAAHDGSEVDCSEPTPRGGEPAFYCPDPVVVSAGPDGAVADTLLAWAQEIQSQIMVGYPDPYFLYEPVAGGQVEGYAGVNAQSDHTSFIAAGVPSYFLFNGNALRNPIGIHNQRDTIDNWTRYMVNSVLADLEAELSEQERVQGEALMAQSLETYLWVTFYLFLRFDLGEIGPVPAGTFSNDNA
jgi:hypothetical protein